jgi:hypothetical protein
VAHSLAWHVYESKRKSSLGWWPSKVYLTFFNSWCDYPIE